MRTQVKFRKRKELDELVSGKPYSRLIKESPVDLQNGGDKVGHCHQIPSECMKITSICLQKEEEEVTETTKRKPLALHTVMFLLLRTKAGQFFKMDLLKDKSKMCKGI